MYIFGWYSRELPLNNCRYARYACFDLSSFSIQQLDWLGFLSVCEISTKIGTVRNPSECADASNVATRCRADAFGSYHKGSVSNGERLITNFRSVDGIVVNAKEEEEADILVNRLDTTTTMYKMKIGPDKTKVITNNPNGFRSEIKIKGLRLQEVSNFKYLEQGIKIRDSFQDSPDNSSFF